ARLVRGQHARPEEPLDPRPAPLDVLAPETVIHRKAAVQLIQRRRGSYTETAAPEPVRRLAGGRLIAGHGLANVALGHLLLRSGQGRHGCAPAPPFSAGARPASSAGSASDSSVAPGDAAPAGSAAESACPAAESFPSTFGKIPSLIARRSRPSVRVGRPNRRMNPAASA